MVPTGDDVNNFVLLKVYDAISVIYASAPKSTQIMLQRFWLSDSFKRISLDIFDNCVDSLQRFSILHLPIKIVIPRSIFPQNSH